jgi:hypothetical protein
VGGSTLRERLEKFIVIETACSVIYSRLKKLCPDGEEIWGLLAKIENNHAVSAMVARRYLDAGSLPEDLVHPSMAELEKTLALINDMEDRIGDSDGVPLGEALAIALELEGQQSKEHFRKALESADDTEEIRVLRKLASDTTGHVENLRRFAEDSLGK